MSGNRDVSEVGMPVAGATESHAEFAGRGVEVSDAQELDWGKFVYFSDPDGNGWAVRQLPARDENAP